MRSRTARLGRPVLLGALLAGLMAAAAGAQTVSGPEAPSNGVEPQLFAPLWETAPRPAAGPRALTNPPEALATQGLPQDAAWEGFVAPGPIAGSHRTVQWQGKLVIASVNVAGHTSCGGVAIWDGTSFTTLPDVGSVQLITVWNNQIVVAILGPYPNYGNQSIMRWNGTTWDQLGVTTNYPLCMAEFDGKLVVAGQLTAVDAVAANHIAWYDGVSWSPIGSGFTAGNGRPTCLATHAGKLYAGGAVQPATGVSVWNSGLGTWGSLGAGLTGTVRALTSDGVSLYAAGSSLAAGGPSFGGLARWDGALWNAIPGAAAKGSNDATFWNGKIVTTMLPTPVGRLSQWDGVTLTSVPGDSIGFGTQLGSTVFYLGTWGSRLVASGSFVTNGAKRLPGIAIFDGAQWSTPEIPWDAQMRSPIGAINSMLEWNGKLVVTGGGVLFADQDHYEIGGGVAVFDGSHWAPLSPNIVFAQYRQMTEWNGDLVIGGYSLSISGTAITKMARWDGANWHALGIAPDFVDAMIVFQNNLYVTDEIGFQNGIARWDGTSWSGLGTGFSTGAAVTLCVHANNLVAGGEFTDVGGVTANRVAVWDGAAWHALGEGLIGGPVDAVVSWNSLLVAGGRFTASGAQPLDGAAYWDGTSWHQMGTNVSSIVYLGAYDGDLFASGVFRLPDNSEIQTLAKWNGTDWQILGSGTNQYPFAFYGDHLYCAGSGVVHGHPSHALSRIPLSAVLDAPRPQGRVSGVALRASPNPSHSLTRFTFNLPAAGLARLTVVDLAGRVVATLADGPFDAGEHHAHWAAAPAPGVYFVRLEAPGGKQRVLRVARID